MAEYLLRHMLQKEGLGAIEVFSRGVGALDGQPMSRHALGELTALGIDGSAHVARALTRQDVERADLILAMTTTHRVVILGGFPEVARKLFLLKEYAGADPGSSPEVADPYGESADAYRQCRMEIQDSLLGVLGRLKSGR